MSTDHKIDCPAFHKRFSGYPYGDRVPRTVRMLVTVTSDRIPGVEPAHTPEARAGQTYPAWTNSHGALVAVMDDGARLGLRPAEFEVDSWHDLAAEPAPQHPEPIAWMVGTAFWWTKEEAERDAAATGLPIVGLGPMPTTASTKQRQGEPVAWLAKTLKGSLAGTLGLARYNQRLNPELYDGPFPVFRHADAGEVERLNDALEELRKAYTELEAQVDSDFKVIDDLRAQQAERDELLRDLAAEDIPLRVAARIEDALSASAGPSSPTWSCQAYQVEQPTDRACDACGGKTELAGAKS